LSELTTIDVTRLQRLIGPQVRVVWQPVVTSTNALLIEASTEDRIAEERIAGQTQRYLLLGADEQTAGRGRRQRPWISMAGRCVTFSVRFPPFLQNEQVHLPSLPLALGLAVVDAIDQWAKANCLPLNGVLALKWPNDVLCNGKKVAGLLVEAKGYVVAGVGINIALPTGFHTGGSASSLVAGGLLADDTGATDLISMTSTLAEDLVARVASLMILAQDHHRQYGLSLIVARWNALHAFQGQSVCLVENEQVVCHGVVQGIRSSGELLIIDDHGCINAIMSGDLSLRLAS
jgi:BirA family transcriptional regulator, biotin operon repressor / biotin---[acetyl-CoA-carboxylase] ligase